jgi:hypothetical protein
MTIVYKKVSAFPIPIFPGIERFYKTFLYADAERPTTDARKQSLGVIPTICSAGSRDFCFNLLIKNILSRLSVKRKKSAVSLYVRLSVRCTTIKICRVRKPTAPGAGFENPDSARSKVATKSDGPHSGPYFAT